MSDREALYRQAREVYVNTIYPGLDASVITISKEVQGALNVVVGMSFEAGSGGEDS